MPERVVVVIVADGPATKTTRRVLRGARALVEDLAAHDITASIDVDSEPLPTRSRSRTKEHRP